MLAVSGFPLTATVHTLMKGLPLIHAAIGNRRPGDAPLRNQNYYHHEGKIVGIEAGFSRTKTPLSRMVRTPLTLCLV